MKKILLVGGEGYIGRVVSKYLLSLNYSVFSFDNLIYLESKEDYQFSDHKNFVFQNGNLKDLNLLDKILDNIDSVVILAGLVGDPITKKYPDISQNINYNYIRDFIDLVKKKNIDKTVFISTCSNYGLINNNEFADEEHELNPLSLYASAKVDIEKYILSQNQFKNFNPTILRFATAFGLSDRMRFDLTVSEFTIELFLKKTIDVYDVDTWRPYCHVKDFARLIEKVLNSDTDIVKNQVFNAGGEENNSSKKNLVKLIQSKINNTKVNYIKNGFDKRNYKVSFKKVNKILNFKPKFSIEDGVDELISALKENNFKDYSINKAKYGNYKIFY